LDVTVVTGGQVNIRSELDVTVEIGGQVDIRSELGVTVETGGYLPVHLFSTVTSNSLLISTCPPV
jgi:hypothetical protein